MDIKLDNADQLEHLYQDAAAVDKSLFAEMRNNIMLRIGKHYGDQPKIHMDEMRRTGVVRKADDKLRLTKNHIYKITDDYINSIANRGPDTVVSPFEDSDLQDQKNAAMANSVLRWIKDTNHWDERKRLFMQDMVVVGETYALLKFEQGFGKVIKKVNEVTGVDANGMEIVKPKEVHEGRIHIEKIFAFDVKRDPDAKEFEDARYFFIDKLIDKTEARRLVRAYKGEEAAQALQDYSGEDGTVTVFDTTSGSYKNERSKVLFREMLIRPCLQYPKGKYILFTKNLVIVSMDLPCGVFPLFQLGFSYIPCSPRCASIIRVARPYQREINRISSKMAQTQITIGNEKLILPYGSGEIESSSQDGVQIIRTQGGAQPQVLKGVTGEQYLPHLEREINEMYQACNLQYVDQDKAMAGDPLQLLFASMRQKAKFSTYVDRYMVFEKDVMTAALKLARAYLTPDHMIKVVGKKELVNIPQFKLMAEDAYDITVEDSNEDVESKFGKLITGSQIIQYAGSSLTPEQIGQIVRSMPYGNKEQAFSDLTSDYDTTTNIILELDRGGIPQVSEYMNLDYLIKHISSRMVKPDFQALGPEIQSNYQQFMQQLTGLKQQQLQAAQQAQMGMIPMDGYLITCNASVRVPDGKGGFKVERLKVPAGALQWLHTAMDKQGAYNQQVGQMPMQVQAAMGQQAAAAGGNINPQEQVGPQAYPLLNNMVSQAPGA